MGNKTKYDSYLLKVIKHCVGNASDLHSATHLYTFMNTSYQHVALSAFAAVCPCHRRLPRSCVSVSSAHTKWKEPLSLG